MIYWINGAYGVGKTTLAEYLHETNPNSFIFDAEEVGNAIRDNLPKELFKGYIFEEYELWFKTIIDLLVLISEKFEGDIYVPMTLCYPDSFSKIKIALDDKNIIIKHILLVSDYQTIHDRIIGRGEEENCWCIKNIDLCLKNQKDFVNVIKIESNGQSVKELALEFKSKVDSYLDMIPRVEWGNIVLRKAEESDLNELYHNLWSSNDVAEYLFWQVSDSLEDAAKRLDRTIKYQTHHHGFVIAYAKTDEVIGITGVYEYEPFCYRESGLCIGDNFQGKGYGKETLEALMYVVFILLKADVFRYSCVSENIRSKNLCKKYGFKYFESKKEIRKRDNKEFIIDYFYLRKEEYFKNKGEFNER